MTYAMLLPFDRDTTDFRDGFEMGRLWAILSTSDDPFDAEIHTTNSEMVLRLAEATGRSVTAHDIGSEGWLTAHFSEREVWSE